MELRLREGVLEPRLPMGKKILIENLPKSFHSDDLKNLFTPYGTVLAAKVFFDSLSNRSLRFGYVEMSTETEAILARNNLNGRFVDEYRLLVILR